MADKADLLLGLDAGNTVIKAVLFDREGRQLVRSARNGMSCSPRSGHVERDPDALWRDVADAIRECIAGGGIDPARIAAVGCAGHGNGIYLVDGAGRALLGIQSLDSRAAALAADVASAHGALIHAISLQKPWPAQTAILLAWIKQNRPELYEATETAFFCKDLVTFRLTGERVSDVSDMSAGGLLRMPDGEIDGRLLDLYGLGDAAGKLPRIDWPTSVVGQVSKTASDATGLPEGTAVVAGLFDVVASAIGSGAIATGQASIVAGTWSINQVVSDSPVVDPNVFMVSSFCPGRYTNIEASATSAANLAWYSREFVERGGDLDDPFGHCNARVAAVTPAADDPIFHPYLYGSGESAASRGGFYGLAGWHSEGHILRALYEGVVFEHRRHIEVLTTSGMPFETAAMSGGGARSPFWPQMMADCLGVEIAIPEGEETGALGAAIAAGVGAELFQNLEDGVTSMTRARTVFRPDPARKAHYDRRYRLYRDLADAMLPFWARLQDLEEGDPLR